MDQLVFFYGTLMAGFDRRTRAGVDDGLAFMGRGWIEAALFDLGIYPAAIPAPGGRVWGEVYRILDPDPVLSTLDQIEGYSADNPDRSLYLRRLTEVRFEDGALAQAWAYFYNAPLGQARRIPSGDYLQHVTTR